MNICTSIVSGIDHGPDTEKNIAYTAYFASKTGANVRLLYIIDYLMTPPAYLASYVEEEKKRVEKEMARLQVLLSGLAIKTESGVMLGRLHESFSKVFKETAADLLIIGYRSHVLRPSSSERLIQSLTMPMLVVRGGKAENASPGSVKIRKILCPVDFSENSRKAVLLAKGYAGLFSADLYVLHVITPQVMQEKREHLAKPQEKGRPFDDRLRDEASAKMALFIKEADITTEGKIVQGTSGHIICSAAEEGAYDMIVMGARGLSYLKGLLIGSTTEDVLKASPCPVLVVH